LQHLDGSGERATGDEVEGETLFYLEIHEAATYQVEYVEHVLYVDGGNDVEALWVFTWPDLECCVGIPASNDALDLIDSRLHTGIVEIVSLNCHLS